MEDDFSFLNEEEVENTELDSQDMADLEKKAKKIEDNDEVEDPEDKVEDDCDETDDSCLDEDGNPVTNRDPVLGGSLDEDVCDFNEDLPLNEEEDDDDDDDDEDDDDDKDDDDDDKDDDDDDDDDEDDDDDKDDDDDDVDDLDECGDFSECGEPPADLNEDGTETAGAGEGEDNGEQQAQQEETASKGEKKTEVMNESVDYKKNTKKIIVKTKEQKLNALIMETVLKLAKKNNDTVYIQYLKHLSLAKTFREKLKAKYSSKAKSIAKKIATSAKK